MNDPNLTAQFEARAETLKNLAALVQARAQTMKAMRPTWGASGDLGHANELLGQAAVFLGIVSTDELEQLGVRLA
jgi:hypothetical protein